jgi:hypothetical protein
MVAGYRAASARKKELGRSFLEVTFLHQLHEARIRAKQTLRRFSSAKKLSIFIICRE